MNNVDFKELVLDAYCNCSCPDDERKVLNEIVDVEDAFLATLNEKQKAQYNKINSLKDELEVSNQDHLVDFVLDIFKSIFS